MDGAAACQRCGIEAPEEMFERRRASLLCPYCAAERRHPALTFVAVAVVLCWPVLNSIADRGVSGLMDHVAGTGVFVAAAMVLVFVHEAGHALVAIALGGDVPAVQIGQGKPRLRFRLGSVRVTVHTFPFGGATMAAGIRGRWRNALFALAGVVTEVIFVAAMVAVTIRTGALAAFTSAIVFMAFLDIVVNLWPRSVKTADGMLRTDGGRLLDVIRARTPEEAEVSMQEHEWSLRFLLPALDRDVEAMLAISEAEVAERPESPDARNRRGMALVLAERFGEGYDQLAPIVDDDQILPSRQPLLWNNAAWAGLMSMNAQLLPVVDRLSLRAREALPFRPEVVSTRGAVLAVLGRRTEADRLLEWAESKLRADEAGTCAAFRALAALNDHDPVEARHHADRLTPGVPSALRQHIERRLAVVAAI